MSYQERIAQLTVDIPDQFAAVAYFWLKNYLQAIESADEEFCAEMYARYLANPDKGSGTPIEDVAARLGVVLE
ncbi:MAG: hypothetical protein FWB76_05320 [Oscillospiraceae bacterium]|nr:hypothetical protein [Oscillospiraceae bacterium]